MHLLRFTIVETDLGLLFTFFGLYTILTGAIFRIQDLAVCLRCFIQLMSNSVRPLLCNW